MEKKRDLKGRTLRSGERQRSNGRYEYRFVATDGAIQSLYSWRLVETDPTPPGKRPCEPLRNLEKKIQEMELKGLDTGKSSTMTLNAAFENYVNLHPKWKPTTAALRRSIYRNHIEPVFGQRKVTDIRQSQIKQLYIDMQRKKGLSFGTVRSVHELIVSIFEYLVMDDIVLKNPARKALDGVELNPVQKRHALTVHQQDLLLDYLCNAKQHWYWRPLIIFLNGTGLRIGEVCALRWRHIDFESNVITVEDNLISYYDENNRHCIDITTTKTEAGERKVPLFKDVKAVLLEKYTADRFASHGTLTPDSFVFTTTRMGQLQPGYADIIIRNIVKSYNAMEEEIAAKEHRVPDLLPKVTPHVLRHTFCTRLCEQGINIKALQSIMGHADFAVTMNIYTEATQEFVQHDVQAFEGKLRIV